jgi:hypothetical protein
MHVPKIAAPRPALKTVRACPRPARRARAPPRRFDDGVSLRAEIARKNMYLHDGAPPAGGGPKRMRTGEYGDGGGGMGGGGMGGGGMGGGGMGGDRRGGQRSAGGLQQQDNPPCNTLFVGNLGASVDREELERVFSTQPVGRRAGDRAPRRGGVGWGGGVP